MLVELHGYHDSHTVEINLATLNFGDITRFKIVMSVYIYMCVCV